MESERLTATANRVAWAMKERGLTQRSLSLAASLSQSMVGQIVRGDVKNSSADTLQKLARAMNVSTGWLITGNGAWEPYEGDEPAPPPPLAVPVRVVVLDARYPNFAKAARVLLASGEVSEETVEEESQIAMHRDFDLDIASWSSMLLASERQRRLRARNPDEADRRESQGKEQVGDEDDPPIGAMLKAKRGR